MNPQPGEPITEARLKAAGFIASHKEDGNNVWGRNGLYLRLMSGDWRWQVGGTDNFWEIIEPPAMETVMMVLSALGVPVIAARVIETQDGKGE